MLRIFYRLRELDFAALMAVYAEGNQENAKEFYPELPTGQALLRAEQDAYQYLRECFFSTEGSVYYVWEVQGCYVSALRLESYRDGMLLEALETAPQCRRRGYAKDLIRAVQRHLGENHSRVYSHVGKKNTASLAVHEACGFRIISDMAVYADGSVNGKCYTLQW